MSGAAIGGPRIGMSTLGADAGRSGIGQYVQHLLSAWGAGLAGPSLELFVARSERDAFRAPSADRIDLPSRSANPFWSFVWHQVGLPALCERRDLDVLFLPAANRRATARSPIPTVGTVHDFSSLHVSGKYGPIRETYIKKVLPALVRSLDRVITPSLASKQDIVDYAGVPEDRVVVVPNGVDHDRFRPFAEGIAEERIEPLVGRSTPYVLYVSRIEHPGKNHVRLVEAFDRMCRREDLPHRLVFAGSDWTRAAAVHAAAEASASSDRIDFLGYVPDELLPALNAAADLVVFPSLYEGFGIPVLEAMASGTPVVASGTSSIPEVGGEAVGYFDPLDIDAIDSAMTRVLTDRRLHASMASAGLERAAGFSWDETARITMDIIVECAEEGRS